MEAGTPPPPDGFRKIGDYDYSDLCVKHGARAAQQVMQFGIWMSENGGFPETEHLVRRMLDESPNIQLTETPQLSFLARLLAIRIADAADEILERFNQHPDLHKALTSTGQRVAALKSAKSRQAKASKQAVVAHYKRIRKEHPNYSKHRIATLIAAMDDVRATLETIRRYLTGMD